MGFSPAIKLKVKHLAAFKCCRCQTTGIQVHHIIPSKDGGSDTMDNAAPLCPSCHNFFGANPVKRKEIKEMRDWWYERVELMYKSPDYQILEQVNDKVEKLLQSDLHRKEEMDDLKAMLKSVAIKTIEELTPETAAGTATFISDVSQIKRVPISDLKPGPIRHNKLPSSFINRIKVIHNTFSDVLNISLEETIENFKRDLHPGREILIWEHVMGAYIDVTKNKNWNRNKKKEALGLLLVNSSGPLSLGDIKSVKYLSKKEVDEILCQWKESWKDS